MLKFIYKAISSVLARRNIYLTGGLSFLGRRPEIPLNTFDYVRVATLELLAKEIRLTNVSGNVAELGVYKAGFAKYINQVFPERKLYLFDTFSGFDEKDMASEDDLLSSDKFQNFSDTTTELVISKMKHPEKCIIRKGYFPDSFEGLNEEVFCFVSIGTDLYEPIYNGLKIFYNCLAQNGFIMVHDYNNSNYKGCRKAVNEFCRERKIPCIPIPDIGGSVVIRKAIKE